MASNKFESLATEELLKKQKFFKTVIFCASALAILAGIFMVYLMVQGRWIANNGGLGIVPFILMAFLLTYVSKDLSAINTELKTRL